ncbi:MAG: ABC transporter substrate binding protein [Xanthobacteraceae bacterium]
MGGDPVKAGLVKSFNRPGGNVTGSVVLTETLEPKRLELLHQIVPAVALFGAIVNPTYPAAADQLRDLEAAVPKFGRRLLVAKASNDDELVEAFALIMRAGVGALVVTSDPFFVRAAVVLLSLRPRVGCLPSINSANMPTKAA